MYLGKTEALHRHSRFDGTPDRDNCFHGIQKLAAAPASFRQIWQARARNEMIEWNLDLKTPIIGRHTARLVASVFAPARPTFEEHVVWLWLIELMVTLSMRFFVE